MNLQMIKQCLCLGYLYQLARQDCRWKKMDAGLVYGFLAAGIICFILEPFLNKAKGNRSMIITMSILFLSLLPGFLFLVIGALTQEAVGYGDGLSILAMGFYMEAYALWKAVGISLTLVTVYVLGQKLLQKHRYKQEQKYEQEQIHKQKQENGQIPKSGAVPFLPFLLTGMVVVLGSIVVEASYLLPFTLVLYGIIILIAAALLVRCLSSQNRFLQAWQTERYTNSDTLEVIYADRESS